MSRKHILLLLIVVTAIRVSNSCLIIDLPLRCTRVKDACSRGVESKIGKDSKINQIKNKLVHNVKSIIPNPHAELILGMVLGFNDLRSIPRFNDVLIRSGTIHVVVVSGYNINLVFNFLSKLFGSNYKTTNLFFLQIIAIIYAIITGFEPPIVRALIMCSMFVWGSFYGRKLSVMYTFIISLLFMLIYDPKYMFDISFQLSGGATLGLILYSTVIEYLLKWLPLPKLIRDDFYTTIAAQVFVWPLISHYFKRVSIVSFISNPLTLWIVPLITLSGVFIVFMSCLSKNVTLLLWLLISPLSHLFVEINEYLSKLRFSELTTQLSSNTMKIYYIVAILIPLFLVNFGPTSQQKGVLV